MLREDISGDRGFLNGVETFRIEIFDLLVYGWRSERTERDIYYILGGQWFGETWTTIRLQFLFMDILNNNDKEFESFYANIAVILFIIDWVWFGLEWGFEGTIYEGFPGLWFAMWLSLWLIGLMDWY